MIVVDNMASEVYRGLLVKERWNTTIFQRGFKLE